jgi:CheY-like chemotaxis protein
MHAALAGLTACIAGSLECLCRVQEAERCAQALDRETRRQQRRWQTFLQATTSLSPSATASDGFMMLTALGPPRRGPQGAQVLIVEDDEELRGLLRFALEEEGYLVLEASDGVSGLEHLRTSAQPLVVLLDWLLPGLDGIEVLQALQADPSALPSRHAFLLMTAALTRHHPFPYLPDLPADVDVRVLAKPFDLERLLPLIAERAARISVAAH